MRTLKRAITISSLAISFGILGILSMAFPVWGQGTPESSKDTREDMRQRCAGMMQKMQSDMKAQDAELDQLVKAMNSAKGDQKVQAMSAVINKLVQQRTEAHAKMAEMCNRMMQCMPEMKSGAASPSPSPSPAGSP